MIFGIIVIFIFICYTLFNAERKRAGNETETTIMAIDRDYYLPSEIAPLVDGAGKSKSTFYRLVKKGKIQKMLSHNEEVYKASDVDAFLKDVVEENGNKVTPRTYKKENLETDWITTNDLLRLYVFDVESYGMDRAVEATTMRAWYQQNPFLTRILYDRSNRSHILGAMTILPLAEELVLRILKGELTERDIAPNDILYYQSGKQYICYIAFATVNPRYRANFSHLFHSYLDFWQSISNLTIPKLYTVTSSTEWDEVIGMHYFAPRYDLRYQSGIAQSDRTDVYELDLRRPNFSPRIQEIQNTMKLLTPSILDSENELVASVQMLSKTTDIDADAITFENARREDLKACYDIDIELYGQGESNPVAVRETRYDKVPSGFYVLRKGTEVIGHTSFVPVDTSELRRIRAGIPGRIPMDKIHPFVIGKPLDIYFIIMSIPQPDPGRKNALRLLAGLTHVFRQLGSQGVNIQHIFAFSRTLDGKRICEEFGMSKEAFADDPERYMFEMNLQTGAPKIAREYQAGLVEYRAKMRQKEFSDY